MHLSWDTVSMVDQRRADSTITWTHIIIALDNFVWGVLFWMVLAERLNVRLRVGCCVGVPLWVVSMSKMEEVGIGFWQAGGRDAAHVANLGRFNTRRNKPSSPYHPRKLPDKDKIFEEDSTPSMTEYCDSIHVSSPQRRSSASSSSSSYSHGNTLQVPRRTGFRILVVVLKQPNHFTVWMGKWHAYSGTCRIRYAA